jgi:hypothetical protein
MGTEGSGILRLTCPFCAAEPLAFLRRVLMSLSCLTSLATTVFSNRLGSRRACAFQRDSATISCGNVCARAWNRSETLAGVCPCACSCHLSHKLGDVVAVRAVAVHHAEQAKCGLAAQRRLRDDAVLPIAAEVSAMQRRRRSSSSSSNSCLRASANLVDFVWVGGHGARFRRGAQAPEQVGGRRRRVGCCLLLLVLQPLFFGSGGVRLRWRSAQRREARERGEAATVSPRARASSERWRHPWWRHRPL